MAGVDIVKLLEPVSPTAPCGRNLDYTPELMALEDSVKEPDEPGLKNVEAIDSRNWREITTRAEKLLLESKDLRIAVIFTRGLLHVQGFSGFCSGFAVLTGIVDRYWDGLYPVLDEPDNDPLARLNALRELWNMQTLHELRSATLVSVRGLGDFSLYDLMTAKGHHKPRAGTTPPAPQVVTGAFEQGTTPELLALAREALEGCKTLEAAVRQKTGDFGFETTPLRDLFGRVVTGLNEYVRVAPEAAAPGVAGADGDAGQAGTETRSVPMAIVGEVQSRDDVVKMLDKISRYYEQHEPSSPVPLLMKRARRLATMNFMEIMTELADKGLPQVEALTGKEVKA